MKENRDIQTERHNRDKDRVIAASAGAIAGTAGIIAAQVSMNSDEEVIEQNESSATEVDSNASNVEVDAVLLDNVLNNEVIICENENEDSFAIEITDIDYSEFDFENIIIDNTPNTTMDDTLIGLNNEHEDITCDYIQFDGEILA